MFPLVIILFHLLPHHRLDTEEELIMKIYDEAQVYSLLSSLTVILEYLTNLGLRVQVWFCNLCNGDL